MNAPLPQQISNQLQQALTTVTLDDKYSLDRGRAFMSGVQALVKLPMLQKLRDQEAGHHTAGFISGYRGSPLGGYDQALWKAQAYLKARDIHFQPGVNEELAATALWGTQQMGFAPPGSNKFDGVFGIWYGKGPGVDRTADVFKHANMAGTTRLGGVLAVAGDDHVAKSSTAAHQSDHIFKACGLPVLFPANAQEVLDMGLHGIAMSRYASVWVGMKTIQEVVESASSVIIDPERVNIVQPVDFDMPEGGLHIRWPDAALPQEARLFNHKWYAALAYIRANNLNQTVIAGPNDRFGIIASGKAYNDARQALLDLGLDVATCQRVGIRVHKVGVVWPLEAQGTREFARGLKEILVVEEKRQMIEYQLKEELYNWRDDVRPNILGKFDELVGDVSGGEWSFPNPTAHVLQRATADLNPAMVAKALGKRLLKLGMPSDIAARIEQHLALLQDIETQRAGSITLKGERLPWFCSGCPHNTSTKVPEGSRATAGIGCSFMALWMDRQTEGFTQMGGEGATWVGQAPFSYEQHIFANLGDGTYFHSGLLAIRQAVAANVNMTYKILYNDAVAMTGGQPVGERPEGHRVDQITHSLYAEGVVRTIIVTDEPDKYKGKTHLLAKEVRIEHRDRLDAVQRELREVAGVTALIYDQTCATEKRRRRKRGVLAEPEERVFINPLVCEGCGDCHTQSNCLSVEPLETEFGRKRKINQSSCNKDFSCTKGFCPSFVTVTGQLKQKNKNRQGVSLPTQLSHLPAPTLPLARQAYGILVAGVGGTGVITIGQLLGMAAHLEGKAVATQDSAGLAQKGGSTWAHVQISDDPQGVHTTRVGIASADLMLACDPIVSVSAESTQFLRRGRSKLALNSHAAPTAAFVHNAEWQNPAGQCAEQLRGLLGDEAVGTFDAHALATTVLGDSIYINPMILGYAWQRGWIPLTEVSILRAIELNGTQVHNNQTAFAWGRLAAADAALIAPYLNTNVQPLQWHKKPSLAQILATRVEYLSAYQDEAYAASYRTFVERIEALEAPLGCKNITEAVAKNLFALMSYKDEYEVARLHSSTALDEQIAQHYEGAVTRTYHLAPPLLAGRDDHGHLRKRTFGAWMGPLMRMLAKGKVLRGSVLDIFGHTAERRVER
ncbi:MAG: hypothetical protein RLZZ502_838, partial [Pseudomonadota bacterium]